MRRWSQRAAPAVLLAALLAAVGCGTDDEPATGDALLVAAASDLRPAFEDLGDRFEARTGTPVTFTFGSSGQLSQQIVNGAPYDVFASANVDYVDDVIAAGRGDEATKADYAEGRLVVWSRPGADRPAVAIDQLVDAGFDRIAVANPEHAPYGAAAVQALRSVGVHDGVADRLVYGENVSDTQRLVRSGNVDVGIIALSLANAVPEGTAVEVPASLHGPLRQALVVTATGRRAETARAFTALVASDEGRDVMASYGFVLPGDDGDGGGR